MGDIAYALMTKVTFFKMVQMHVTPDCCFTPSTTKQETDPMSSHPVQTASFLPKQSSVHFVFRTDPPSPATWNRVQTWASQRRSEGNQLNLLFESRNTTPHHTTPNQTVPKRRYYTMHVHHTLKVSFDEPCGIGLESPKSEMGGK